MSGEHYRDFVEEAFLKPIRSVLIIDDDYPTFDEILDNRIASNGGLKPEEGKAWYKNPARIKRVISSFRVPERPLLVDVHDGSNVNIAGEQVVASHLHQSDLLVLDYELDRAKPGDGSRAIEILRRLMLSDHLNLVVIHTSADLGSVFQAVVTGLLNPGATLLSQDEQAQAEELIEAEESREEGFTQRLFESVSVDQYLAYRTNASGYLALAMRSAGAFAAFGAAAGVWAGAQKKLVLKFCLDRVGKAVEPLMNTNSMALVEASSSPVPWVRSEALFVAFSSKGDEDDLMGDLAAALYNWKPAPSRLFLAKLRAAVDERGVVAQTAALGNNGALAYWYDRLLQADDESRRWLIAESISRHTDQLMDAIGSEVEDYANRLIMDERQSATVSELSKEHFKVDLSNESQKRSAHFEHNVFVCSKKPAGWHLTTGHIFSASDTQWLCLSPACDLVPGQMSAEDKKNYGQRMPFVAIKLHPVRDSKQLDDIQSNRYIFFKLDGELKCFSSTPLSGSDASPNWQTFLAENTGRFDAGTFEFSIHRLIAKDEGIVSRIEKAKVVGQLRYEYALNLMQRLGNSLTRIGLDFAG